MQKDLFEKGLSPLQKEQLGRIAHMLDGMGCKFVLMTPDGDRYGNTDAVKIVKAKLHERKKRPLKYPMGTWSNYIKPYLVDLKEGEVALIPYGDFDREDLARNVCATANTLWGKKSYISAPRDNGVEIMRGSI